MSLRARILDEIAERGPMPFSRYLELCLYDRDGGYYERAAEQFGKAGDFYTSSDVHAVFGRLLARQFDEMWRALGGPPEVQIVELGPGRGLFARDVLDWTAARFPPFHAALRYTLVERSAALRKRLAQRFEEAIAAGKASVKEGLQEMAPAANVIVFANEFFDALPVEVVSGRGQLRLEARSETLVETWAPPPAAVLEYLDCYGVHPEYQ